MAREVEDVLALATLLGEPMVVAGHSSGAVVALEALAAAPAAFAGAVLFEPPVATSPLPGGAAIELAKAAIAAGQPGRAMQIFVRDVVGMPASQAWLIRPLTAVIPKMRSLAPRQITDLDGLGPRLDVYAQIQTPVVLGGERSPAHLGKSLDALAAVMPCSEKVILARRDHSAHLKAAGEVAHVIETLAGKACRNRRHSTPPSRTVPRNQDRHVL